MNIEQLQQQRDMFDEAIKSIELLTEIWNELGPYENGLSPELNSKLLRYFHFDDSE